MSNKFVIYTVTALILAGFTAIPAGAKNAKVKAGAGVSGNVMHNSFKTDANVNASTRVTKVRHRPYGWSQGKKRGWGCRVGDINCVPPGQRKNY